MVEAEFQNLRNISFIEIAFSIAAWKVFVDEQMGDICSSADVKTVFIDINIFNGDKVSLVFKRDTFKSCGSESEPRSYNG